MFCELCGQDRLIRQAGCGGRNLEMFYEVEKFYRSEEKYAGEKDFTTKQDFFWIWW